MLCLNQTFFNFILIFISVFFYVIILIFFNGNKSKLIPGVDKKRIIFKKKIAGIQVKSPDRDISDMVIRNCPRRCFDRNRLKGERVQFGLKYCSIGEIDSFNVLIPLLNTPAKEDAGPYK